MKLLNSKRRKKNGRTVLEQVKREKGLTASELQKGSNSAVFVTASNSLYRDVCDYNAYCAIRYGGFDKVIQYDVDTDLDVDYKEQHKDILREKRGAGLWIWKVYFIEKALREECNEGDVLFYADAASFFFPERYSRIAANEG